MEAEMGLLSYIMIKKQLNTNMGEELLFSLFHYEYNVHEKC